jgi:hypothetical protein
MSSRSEETPAAPGGGEPVATKLLRIAEKARKDTQFKFTSLFHLMNVELLWECFRKLRKDAAAGIDQMTKEKYAENLEANLSNLVDRLHRMAYIPQPVRRKYIPKPGSTKQRPLGIPCGRDCPPNPRPIFRLFWFYAFDPLQSSIGIKAWLV